MMSTDTEKHRKIKTKTDYKTNNFEPCQIKTPSKTITKQWCDLKEKVLFSDENGDRAQNCLRCNWLNWRDLELLAKRTPLWENKVFLKKSYGNTYILMWTLPGSMARNNEAQISLKYKEELFFIKSILKEWTSSERNNVLVSRGIIRSLSGCFYVFYGKNSSTRQMD